MPAFRLVMVTDAVGKAWLGAHLSMGRHQEIEEMENKFSVLSSILQMHLGSEGSKLVLQGTKRKTSLWVCSQMEALGPNFLVSSWSMAR